MKKPYPILPANVLTAMNDRKNLFDEEEMQAARTTDIVELFERTGFNVVKKGSYYSLKEAPHVMAKGRCRYYDNYKRQQGDAITFLQDYCNMSFSDAVKYLLDYQGKTLEKPPSSARQDRTSPKEQEFILPEANADHRRVYAYLKKRGISFKKCTYAKQA